MRDEKGIAERLGEIDTVLLLGVVIVSFMLFLTNCSLERIADKLDRVVESMDR